MIRTHLVACYGLLLQIKNTKCASNLNLSLSSSAELSSASSSSKHWKSASKAPAPHLFAKFKAIAGQANHAIVLISGDDVGAAFRDFGHPAGEAARLEFRARQNVILELGFFYGKLSEEHVFEYVIEGGL